MTVIQNAKSRSSSPISNSPAISVMAAIGIAAAGNSSFVLADIVPVSCRVWFHSANRVSRRAEVPPGEPDSIQ
ncbi:hypothetical protein SDC9_200257 [bioreactor metagenome]|uniref:Uncharacterized protein n=1 Tax=bioreactor metagenome TaxID=1076179 RepID=A0A645IMN8_9ZZZZ